MIEICFSAAVATAALIQTKKKIMEGNGGERVSFSQKYNNKKAINSLNYPILNL